MLNCLSEYKNKLIGIAKTENQKKFMNDSFSRWYINCLSDKLFPNENPITEKL